ncbi:hypothetical protein LQW54_007824 [Pestalotiopsis sp. IQ-011]
MSNSIGIQGFQGMTYSRQSSEFQKKDYDYFNQQYASSSHQKDHDMNPKHIVQPKDDDDVIAAVNWARDHKVAVAVKSGGHQYSGASSTGGENIQIDLTNTYKDMMVLENVKVPSDRAMVRVGVSNQLQDFNAYLKDNGLFVPHGQCAYVCVGGHLQTGGFGQLARSFGLFGDHVRKIHMIDYAGKQQEVTKESDPELFYAITGGSPGNFGINTHYDVEVYRADHYDGTVAGFNGVKGPHGWKGLFLYNKKVLADLLQILANMSDNAKMPRNYDLCLSVLSTHFPVTKLFPDLQNGSLWQNIQKQIKSALADDVLDLLNGKFPAIIVIYAQWCPITKEDKYDAEVDAWFEQFRKLQSQIEGLFAQEFNNKGDKPDDKVDMAKMTGQWIFPEKREFDLPYEKRTWVTNATNLATSGWVQDVVDRLELIYNPQQKLGDGKSQREQEVYDHCKLSVQIQAYGGDNSQFRNNRNNGTSYSWRDTTMVQVLDCFYHDRDDDGRETDRYKKYAAEWQLQNDAKMVGPKSNFSKTERRVLWGSYGDWDLSKPEIWKTYYEDEAKYKRLGEVRGRADPNGTFTANPFAVKAIRASQPSSHL